MGLHLGDPAVVGGRVQEVVGAVRGIVVVPENSSNSRSMISAGDSPYEYRGVAAPLLPLDHVGDHLIVGEVGVAVEVDRLAEDGGDVLRV